jgi:hypothetical protein
MNRIVYHLAYELQQSRLIYQLPSNVLSHPRMENGKRLRIGNVLVLNVVAWGQRNPGFGCGQLDGADLQGFALQPVLQGWIVRGVLIQGPR